MISGLQYAPVVKYGIPDIIEDGEGAYHEFWSENIDRCYNGYQPEGGLWIPGNYYFYLNFGTIMGFDSPEARRKVPMRPHYRDGDHEFYNEIHYARNAEEVYGIIVGKSRRRGYTWMIVHLYLHEFSFFDHVEMAVGSEGETDKGFIKTWRENFEIAWSHMPQELRPSLNSVDNKFMLKTAYKEKINGQEYELGLKNIIHWANFANPGTLRGKALAYGTWEEAGQIKKLTQSYLATWDCFKEGSVQYGVPIIGGTSDKIEHDNLDYQEMYNNAKKYNLKPLFLSADQCFYGFYDIETGISDRIGAHQFHEKKLAELKSSKDQKAYWSYKNQWPLNASDLWIIHGGTKFEIDLINDQIAYIDASRKLQESVQRGYFKWKIEVDQKTGKEKKHGVQWIDDQNGAWFKCGEPMPQYKNLDVGGVDPYFLDDKLLDGATESESKGAICIYRRRLPGDLGQHPVAIYHDRPYYKEMFYEQAMLAAIYYNSPMLAEYGDDEFFKYFIDNGFMHLLKARPLIADSPWSKAENRFGLHMKSYQKNLLESLVDDDIKRNIGRHRFIALLRELAVYGIKNTDLAMAYGISLIHDYDLSGILVREVEEEVNDSKSSDFPNFVETADGRLLVPQDHSPIRTIAKPSTIGNDTNWIDRLNMLD